MAANRRARVLGALAALGLSVSALYVAAAPALAVTCPTVAIDGTVTPAPSPGVDWSGCDLRDANLGGASMAGANLQNANLANAYLPDADLANANLSGANLTNATPAGANLSSADLASANLYGTLAGGADLKAADLTNAMAFGAHLINADFKNAIIHSVDFSSADLSYADFFGAAMTSLTTDGNTLWSHAICPNGADADYYSGGCLGTVNVSSPTATPTVTKGTPGKNGWYTSRVTVTWYWVDSNPLGSSCPASTISTQQGSAVAITATCTDSQGHTGNGSQMVSIDTRPPTVGLTGLTDGATYPLGKAPITTARCVTTDAVSGVGRQAALTFAGGRPDGTGVFTVTCSGAQDVAGNNQASTVTAHYTVVYLFGGFITPKPGTTLKASARTITVRYRLVNQNGVAIPANTAKALAAARAVRATLRGPFIKPVVSICTWNSLGKYLRCSIPTPRHVRTGTRHRYTITASENLGTGFVTVPVTAASENPETVHFR